MNGKTWLEHKPETAGDWLRIIALTILFYLALGHLDLVWRAAARVCGILSPFAGAVVLAYVLDPIVRWFCRHVLKGRQKHRWLGILTAYLILAVIAVLLVLLVLPQVISSITMLITSIPQYVANVQEFLRQVQQRLGVDTTRMVQALGRYDQVLTELTSAAQDMMPQIIAYVQGVVSNVVAIFTALAGSVYMLAEKEKLLRQLRAVIFALLPRRTAEQTLRVCRIANGNISGFFSGKLVDSTLVGVTLFLMMTVLKMEFAPLISVVVGITDIIPVFGPFLGAIPSALILLLADPFQSAEFLVLILVIQQVDGNIIAPKILGESIGLSALWVLFAIVVGGDLFGVVGMVLGVPVFATVYTLFGEFIRDRLERRGIDEQGRPKRQEKRRGKPFA